MDNSNEPNHLDPGIDDVERSRVFVTMLATFKDEERCRVAMETIVSDAHAADGVTSHFWFRSDDGASLFVIEQYENEGALRSAVRRFTSARLSFFRSIKVAEVAVHGDVSFVIKAMFFPLRPTYMTYFGGYSKNVIETQEPGIKGFERNRVFIATNAASRGEQQRAALMTQLVSSAYAEPGTNSHFWTTGKDGEALSVLEQYADEHTLIDYLGTDPSSSAALAELAELNEITIYGAESDEVRAAYAPLNPTYMSYYGGYSK